ncbi:MAG: DUF86 domain-containing protein [Flavobacteriales bacterium]|jgi:uncharacterized protein with HEPN domain
MSPVVRRYDHYVRDMVNAINSILLYTKEINYEEFTTNHLIRDAVIRNFEILGESAKHIPFKVQKTYKHIPWRHMLSLRNFIVHEYFDIDDEILWQVIQVDLSNNRHDLQQFLQNYEKNGWMKP